MIYKDTPSFLKLRLPLHNKDLWSLNKRSAAGGIAVGLFINFLPVPFQMALAGFLAFCLSVNLPLAIAMTWINNPFTFVPINYIIYKTGLFFLGNPNEQFPPSLLEWHYQDWWENFIEGGSWLIAQGKPYLLGVIIVSVSMSMAGYFLTIFIWSLHNIIKKKRNKKKKRNIKSMDATSLRGS